MNPKSNELLTMGRFVSFFYCGSSVVILSEVPPNCTQSGEGPLNTACSFLFFFAGYWHDRRVATEVAVHFLS